jgi:hypothetical protein
VTSAKQVLEFSRAFLAGRRGFVVVLQAYFDESGTHSGSPVLTVGCYYARPSVWNKWTKDWNRKKQPINVFHANECNERNGQFEGWSRPDRDKLVIDLLPTLTAHKLKGIVSGINLVEFEEAAKETPEIRQTVKDPYFTCFSYCMFSLLSILERDYPGDGLAVVHEQNDYREQAEKTFKFVWDVLDKHRHKMWFSFGSKEMFVPLQAADVLAYDGNHLLRDLKKAPRPSWLALKPDENINVQFLHKDRFHILLDAAKVKSVPASFLDPPARLRQNIGPPGWGRARPSK